MLIKDMFEKDIDRDIQGVIKVGQDDQENIKQELEEYVVTRELQKHFRDFFANYKKSINNYTDKMGVWISGFFGSGKSHFLKILSYLLENKEVGGKKALDYFIEDEKINDPMVIGDMKLACNIPTDVVLFNIDSKSESSGSKSKDSILKVFLRVFNEMQGFSNDPHLADLERQLSSEKKYKQFKDSYKRLHGIDWIEDRKMFRFRTDNVVDVLVDIDYMSKDAANQWIGTTIKEYEISIDYFANMVKEYLDSKGEDHHIVFLVDEIGQYIGSDTDLMLNLQTITEDLGTACKGKAWVVVTSQQDIDAITKVSGDDFSKIQGRFDTRLNLTSANVDEVIKLRILEKTKAGEETLHILYENNKTIIKNLILFNDGVDKKLYENKEDFSNVYPFIPYQFNLLASTLTSIREHGASGKHLSEGERSMLALFKESAEKIMYEEDGEIVSYNLFYDGLEQFLDHSQSAVITRALANDKINPNKDDDNFSVNVLKVLFLIKHVKEIEANLENITTLMVTNINQDRMELRDKVEKALNVLISQTLVQKNGDLYIFLTNEEQEVTNEIKKQTIETQAITNKISEMIFAEIYSEESIKYDKFGNRYNFGFNRFVDGNPYQSNQDFDLGVDIITPLSEKNGIKSNLIMSSQDNNIIYIDMPKKDTFIDEIRTELQIRRYLRLSEASNNPKVEQIKTLKEMEMSEHNKYAKAELEEALKDVKIYYNGNEMELGSNSNFTHNLDKVLKIAVENVYHKLDYIDKAVDMIDIKRLFKSVGNKDIQLDTVVDNENALMDVLQYITIRTSNHSKISIKEIKENFMKAPYGFLAVDVEWIIAKLYIEGKISLTLNGEMVSLINDDEEDIINYITKRTYEEKLLIEEKEVINSNHIRSLKNIYLELFKKEIRTEDTDLMAKDFNDNIERLFDELSRLSSIYKENKESKYPGRNIIRDGIELINKTRGFSDPVDIFETVFEYENDYLDFIDDYEPIEAFLKDTGNQRKIWDRSNNNLDVYIESKNYIVNRDLESIIKEMENILGMANPYGRIKDLPELNDNFLEEYNKVLNEALDPVINKIETDRDRILDELKDTEIEEKYRQIYINSFMELKKRARDCNNVAKVNSYQIESETLKMKYLEDISRELTEIEEKRQKEIEKASIEGQKTKPKKINMKRKNINIKDVNPSNSWRIENEEDLDEYINQLKDSLKSKMEENTILNIEF